jgi:hypothetical protein
MVLIYDHYPRPIRLEDMKSDIQFITQVLSIIIGISIIGASVHLSSYASTDRLRILTEEIASISEPLIEHFVSNDSPGKKISNSKFGKYLFNFAKIDKLIFIKKNKCEVEYYWILRPYWDGVWYQIHNSPFAKKTHSQDKIICMQYMHESFICAVQSLSLVYQLRRSGSSLLSENSSSGGSKWFIEALEEAASKYKWLKQDRIPNEVSIEEGLQIIKLAFQSQYYMWEELREYAEELNWKPYELGKFQVIFIDYLIWTVYFTIKFQFMRLSIVETRWPSASKKLSDKVKGKMYLDELIEIRKKLHDARKRVIAEFGVSKHYYELKKASIPGFGISAIVLLAIVIIWPIKEMMGSLDNILLLFSIFYAAGAVSICHGIYFMYQLLWKKRRSYRLSPISNKE